MAIGPEGDITSLLQQLKQGNKLAFSSLYRLYSRTLLSHTRKLTKNNEVAKELVQDLFLKIWENRAAIDVEKSFKSYLFTIGRNLVYDYFRRVALDKRALAVLIDNAFDYYTHIDEAIDLKACNELIQTAIGTLTPQCRRVFTLSRLEGKSHQVISDELGLSISTINNHMVKANREVRAYLYRHQQVMAIFWTTLVLYMLK